MIDFGIFFFILLDLSSKSLEVKKQ